MAGHAFVSYSHVDGEYVARLVATMRVQGLPVWYDDGIEPGDKWIKTIVRQIDECAAFVPVISTASLASEWVERELLRADQLHKPMLPLLLSGEPPIQLANVQHEPVHDGRLPRPVWFERLARTLASPSQPPAARVAVPVRPGIHRGHTSRVRAVAWSANGRLLASGGEDSLVLVRDPATGEIRRRIGGHADWICAVAWSPTEPLLAMAGGERRILVAGGSGTQATLTGHLGNILSLAWSRDGRQIASASFDGRVLVHQARGTGQPVVLNGHCGQVFGVSWARTGLLATGSADRTVRLWDPLRAVEVRRPYPHGDEVRSVAWSPDGSRLASACVDPAVRIWDVATDSVLLAVPGAGRICSLAWSPDGRLLAGGCADGAVRVWDADTGAEQATLTGHTGPVRAVAWAPGDSYGLASGGDDATVRVHAYP